MATKASSNKTSTKTSPKSSSRTATTAKKTTAKKAPIKKPVTKKSSVKKHPQMKSMKLAPETDSFMTTKFTMQTFYWVIICLLSLSFALWILTLQIDINDLYDEIETLQQDDISISDKIAS